MWRYTQTRESGGRSCILATLLDRSRFGSGIKSFAHANDSRAFLVVVSSTASTLDWRDCDWRSGGAAGWGEHRRRGAGPVIPLQDLLRTSTAAFHGQPATGRCSGPFKSQPQFCSESRPSHAAAEWCRCQQWYAWGCMDYGIPCLYNPNPQARFVMLSMTLIRQKIFCPNGAAWA
jgi:hypothetical protein